MRPPMESYEVEVWTGEERPAIMIDEGKAMPNIAAGPAYEWERVFTLRNRNEVVAFVQRHSFLAALLGEAYGQIQNYFPDVPVFLEVMADPEVEDADNEELVASIGTNLRGAAAHEAIKRFDHDWWLDAARRAQGKLCIKLEFR